jgi:NADH-quinone oxidoreductase subunit J
MSLVFYAIAGLSVAGALAAVLLKNTVHCALALTIVFAGLAMLFLGLDAQFAGFAQILIYIGAVAILVVFAILLTRGSETPAESVYSRGPAIGLVIAAALFAVLGWAVLQSGSLLPHETATPVVSVNDIGNALMGR